MLTDRGTEYCGNPEHHEYELYLAVEDIDHSRTKTKSPQTNGICERFHKTVLNEFYRVAFRKKLYASIADLQERSRCMGQSYNRASEHPSVYVIERKRSCWLGCDPVGYFRVLSRPLSDGSPAGRQDGASEQYQNVRPGRTREPKNGSWRWMVG